MKQREKVKRRGRAEGEQAQPEESGLGGGDLEPPLPKKTKKTKEKSNGLAGESDGSLHTVKPSSAASNGVTSPAAQITSGDAADGEQDSDTEVVMPAEASSCLIKSRTGNELGAAWRLGTCGLWEC